MEHAGEENSTWVFCFRVAQVCSLSFKIKIGNAWQNPVNWPLRDIEMKSTSTAIFTFRREKSINFFFTSKGLTLEGFTTFMDCWLRTRASNVVRNEVDYLGGIDWMAAEWGCTLSNSTHRSGYRVGFWIRQHLIFECNYRRWAKHDFSTIVQSEYRGNQIQEDIFRFLLIIRSQALAHCFRFLAG